MVTASKNNIDMITTKELIEYIENLEDNGVDLMFNEVMLQVVHKDRPDVPITIYIGGNWEDQVGINRETLQ